MTESRWFSDVTEEELHEEWKDLTLEKHSWAYCYGHGHEILRLLHFLKNREQYVRQLQSVLQGETVKSENPRFSYRRVVDQYECRFGKRLPNWLRRYKETIQREAICFAMEYDVPLPRQRDWRWLQETYGQVKELEPEA